MVCKGENRNNKDKGELGMDTMYGTTLMDNTLDTLIAVYLLDPDRGDK